MNDVGFSDGLECYIPPSDEEIREVITEGLVVVDTNVLLDLYRFTGSARSDLLAALNKLGKRLWVPYQVRLEFHRNRLKVMAGREDAYSEVLSAFEAVQKAGEEATLRIREFANRVLLPENQRDELLKKIPEGVASAIEMIGALRKAHALTDSDREDPILRELQALLLGRVGKQMPPEDLEKARLEAAARIEEGRPPGGRDSLIPTGGSN